MIVQTDLQQMAEACTRAANFYFENPEAAGPETVIDIYRAMAAIAYLLDTQFREVPLLSPAQAKKLH